MAPDSDLSEVYRALGRIEGRLQAVEQRTDQQNADIKEAMVSLTSKIEAMSAAVEDLRLARARQRGGIAMLAGVAAAAATLGGLFASYFRILFH